MAGKAGDPNFLLLFPALGSNSDQNGNPATINVPIFIEIEEDLFGSGRAYLLVGVLYSLSCGSSHISFDIEDRNIVFVGNGYLDFLIHIVLCSGETRFSPLN